MHVDIYSKPSTVTKHLPLKRVKYKRKPSKSFSSVPDASPGTSLVETVFFSQSLFKGFDVTDAEHMWLCTMVGLQPALQYP